MSVTMGVARAAAFACVSAALAGQALLSACGPKEGPGPPVGVSHPGDAPLPSSDKVVTYEFEPIDERPVSSEVMRGKPSVLAFVSTGDIVGQAQVSYLVHMARNDGDRVNYAMIAIHPRKEIVLVEAYRKTLGVEFPVALADGGATNASGPFGEIPAVPTIVILDRAGHIVWKHTGLAKSDEIRAHLRGL